MNIDSLPPYVRRWLTATPFPVEISADTFLAEAESWDVEALAAQLRGDDDAMVVMAKSRAADMREAARIVCRHEQ